MWWSEQGVRGVAAILLLSLAGCGFQFRGNPDFPPQMSVMHIATGDRYSPFYRELVGVLRRSEIRLTDNPVEARTILRILTDDTGRRLLSVTARNVPAEYEVYYRVRFSVTVDGVEEVPLEQLALTRDFAFDETQVLGKASEEENIRRAIASDLVGLVTRRLTAVH
ncbi:MAG: LPS assembly lipoprotein LptE [Gammaproteobacteria bacterium]|nr:LPS assembly lipoprotein LptE [Gammaproteobacteria bacterium]